MSLFIVLKWHYVSNINESWQVANIRVREVGKRVQPYWSGGGESEPASSGGAAVVCRSTANAAAASLLLVSVNIPCNVSDLLLLRMYSASISPWLYLGSHDRLAIYNRVVSLLSWLSRVIPWLLPRLYFKSCSPLFLPFFSFMFLLLGIHHNFLPPSASQPPSLAPGNKASECG